MEADKHAAAMLSRVTPSLSSAIPPINSLPQPQPAPAQTAKQRQVFNVELRSEETTVVSWKKLIKESGSGNGEDSAGIEKRPELEAGPVTGLGGEDRKHTLQPPNCFSTVIEKIERLYMGKESSDDEELVAPDDEQYDTEDSFIDDTELDEYFQVDKLSTKHNGYFVNRGKLEWNESSSSPNLETKKRRRKDSAEVQNEMDHEHLLNEHANRGHMKIKAAARSSPLAATSLNPGKVVSSYGEYDQEGKHLKIKPNASTVIFKKKSADLAINLDVPPTRILNKDVLSGKLEPKNASKDKSISSKGFYKSSCTSESLDIMHQTCQEKAAVSQVEPQQKKLFNCESKIDQLPKIRSKDRYKTCEYPQISSSTTSYPTQTVEPLSHRVSEVTIKPKGTTLERAILELEKIVAVSRPPNPAVPEVEPSGQGVKRRLPQEVKQKLAKVASLSVSQNKISEEELIDRLMVFLGHLVQRKTLKRNMREMVELGISAKQQKADKLQQIKVEVHEMIKSRVTILKSKGPDQLDGSADDFQNVISNDERRALTGRYSMDVALEEKLCDLYDLFVEGMDEDKGPQCRKLYVEFAALWPAGYMDNLGIKDAIYRAKKRRQHKLQVRNKERIERKKLDAAVKLEEPSLITQPQAGQERHMVSPFQVPRPQDKLISNLSPPLQNKLNDPTLHRSDACGSKLHEKARGNSTDIISDGGSKIVSADVKKKMKRKSEIEGESHAYPQKMQARPGKVKNLHRPNNNSNLSIQPKPSIQMPASPSSSNPADHR